MKLHLIKGNEIVKIEIAEGLTSCEAIEKVKELENIKSFDKYIKEVYDGDIKIYDSRYLKDTINEVTHEELFLIKYAFEGIAYLRGNTLHIAWGLNRNTFVNAKANNKVPEVFEGEETIIDFNCYDVIETLEEAGIKIIDRVIIA